MFTITLIALRTLDRSNAPDEQKVRDGVVYEGFRDGLRSGAAGALAGVLQVLALMWLRTVMNVQYAKGGSFYTRLCELWQEGGLVRLYRGVSFALIQNPLSRFGDAAANTGVIAMLEAVWPERKKVFFTGISSFVAALWRFFITPIDVLKTVLQVDGFAGLASLRKKYKHQGLQIFWSGGLAIIFVNWFGTYSWFLTYNLLQDSIPNFEESMIGFNFPRQALIGICSSIVSDSATNSIRVLKTVKQVSLKSGYFSGAHEIIETDGLQSVLFRGLETRLLSNALQGAFFSVAWRAFDSKSFQSRPNSRRCFSIIGAGKRAAYFTPPLQYLVQNLNMKICGVYTRSGRIHPVVKRAFPNITIYRNLRKMIEWTKPVFILILIHGESNDSVLHEAMSQNYNGRILIETPTRAATKIVFEQRHRVGVLENWPWLPLELVKQKAVHGGILGNVTRVINDRRSICTHGSAMVRKYVGSQIPVQSIKKDERRGYSLVQAEDSNGIVIVNKFPKGGAREMSIFGTYGSLHGNCVVNKESNLNTLRFQVKGKPVADFHLEVIFAENAKTDLPDSIVMRIGSKAFSWSNELKLDNDIALDQKQYGSLQHLLAIAKGEILYPLEQHLVDLDLC